MTGLVAHRRGFTLLELLISLAILSALAVLAYPAAETLSKKRREHELMLALREIRGALDAYKDATNRGRIAIKLGDSGYPPSLEALVEGVPDATSQEGGRLYFLRRVPVDPFYEGPPVPPSRTWGLRSYASPRDQPRAGVDVFDVFSLSEEVGSNDIPYREW